jgi:hypothetical protein
MKINDTLLYECESEKLTSERELFLDFRDAD